MTKPPFARLFVGASLIVGATLTWQPPQAAGAAQVALAYAAPEGPLLIPHVLRAARELVPVDGQLFVHNPHSGSAMRLTRMRVVLDGLVIEERALDHELIGDGRFFDLVADIERLPRELTELNRENRALPAGTPPASGPDVTRLTRNIEERLQVLREEWNNGQPEPFMSINLNYQLDQLFWPNDPAGTVRPVTIELDWQAPGQSGTARVSQNVKRLAASLGLPKTLERTGGKLAVSMPHEHAGDLHVHSCRGEATGACAPSGNCGAETLQVSGSFSYAQLKSQYIALGVDWFTATDHSYCIDSASEYNGVLQECAGLTTSDFLVAPDTELSSDETGPQTGSDLGDAVCLGATSSNHMGAHGISSWMHGGSQGFWGFCDGFFTDELEPFGSNITKIRNNGGYPIVNHPADSSFAFNSVASLQGIEANAAHGVEIWNGQDPDGQGGNVAAWINWLKTGRILYAYSGSDTHDEALPFGENRVLLEANEAFTLPNLHRAIREGRVYLSNKHVLIHEAELGGDHIGMGSLQALSPQQQGQTVTLEAHYNFGTDTGTITLFAGVNGGNEAVLATSAPLTGEGVYTTSYVPPAGVRSWTRGYSEGAGFTAYTNPIFYSPSSAVSTPFGTSFGGTNTGLLTSASAPAIGSTVELDIQNFPANFTAFLGFSGQSIPTGIPIAGGTLLINYPTLFQTQVPTDASGAGNYNTRIPLNPNYVGIQIYWQAATVHPTQQGNLLFSNGLSMPIFN